MYKLIALAVVLIFAANAAAQPIRFKGSAIVNSRYTPTPRTQGGAITLEGEYANDLTLPLDEIHWNFDITTDGQSVTIHDMTASYLGTVQINPLVSVDLELTASIIDKTVDINPTTSLSWRVQQHEFTSISVSGIYHGLGLTKSFAGSLPDLSSSTYEMGSLYFGDWPNQLTWMSEYQTSGGVNYPLENRDFESPSRNGWIGVEPYLHVRAVEIWEPVSVILTPTPSATDTADFNLDGAVDGADFLKWQRDDGSAVTLNKWKQQFGTTAPVAAVPEPSSVALALLAIIAIRRRAN